MKEKLIPVGGVWLKTDEVEALRLATKGLTHEEIAEEMYLSESHIEKMLGNADPFRAIYPKIGVKNKAEAAAWYTDKFGMPRYKEQATNSDELPLETTVLSSDLLELCTDYSKRIYQVRIRGDPHLAIKMANYISNKIMEKDYSSKFYEPFLEILVNVLYEQGLAYSETSSYGEIWTAKTLIIDKLRYIANKYKHKEFAGLANEFLGDAYYVVGQYDKSIRWLQSALDTVKKVEPKLTVLRTLAKIWAYQNEQHNFEEMKIQVMRLIDEGQVSNPELLCVTLGNLARAQALLKLPEAIKTMEEAKGIYGKMGVKNNSSPLRQIELMKDELEMIQHLQPTDKAYLEERGKEGLHMARAKYPRLARRIQIFLEQTLN